MDSDRFAEPGPLGSMARRTGFQSFENSVTSPLATSLAAPADAQSEISSRGVLDIKLQFHLLDPTPEDRMRRRLALGFSPLLEVFGLLLLVWIAAQLPTRKSEAIEELRAEVIHFVANPAATSGQLPRLLRPPPTNRAAPKQIVSKPRSVDVRPRATEQVAALLIGQTSQVLPAPLPPVALALPSDNVPDTSRRFSDIPPISEFPGHDSAIPPLKPPLPKTQIGGFGDLSQVADRAPGGRRSMVAKLGSFDLPNESGEGKDSEPRHDSHRVVAGGDFGNGGVAPFSAGGLNGSESGKVQKSGFGDVIVQEKAPKAQSTPSPSALEPVVILFKPKPVYPEEARQLRLEGEVVLSVVFEASGKIRVRRVIQGLGYGMNEAATLAAKQILFKPARRDGRPVDSEAAVHIIFQLAY